MNYSLIGHMANIVLVNELEAIYCLFLQCEKVRNCVLKRLREICTDDFVKKIIQTYQKKLDNGEVAILCSFPVDVGIMREKDDGSISFSQCVFIEWSGGQRDSFTTTHHYFFVGDKIANETGCSGRQIRRSAE